MAEDIFKYAPISEWNGYIVDFGMPSTDGDIRLTEICLAADACLEASKNAMDLSFTDSSFVKARSAPVQKIIRTLFGEETGIEIHTFQATADDGSIHFMSPMVSAAMELLGKDWEYEIVSSKMDIGFHPTIIETDTSYPIGQEVRKNSTWHQRQVLNPFAVGQIITGNRPISGNWDVDGEPYWEINWDTIQFGRCSDNVQTSEGACTSTVLGGVCREMYPGRGYCSDSAYRNDEINCLSFGTCSDPAYNNNESGCVGNSNVWSPTNTWSSSIGTPPLALRMNSGFCSNPSYDGQYDNCINYGNEWTPEGWVEANIDYYSGGYYCKYANTNNWGVGKCFYSATNSNLNPWTWWGSGSEATCKDYLTNAAKWAYVMWIPPDNEWNEIYAVWRPSYDGTHTDIHGNSDYIQGTVDNWKHFNIKTANNQRKYPINHVPTQTGTNLRIYHGDTNSSWGNGTEIGRSTTALWVTNSFDWADNDNTYDYCMSGSTHIEEWSSPNGYIDDVACLAAGTCSGHHNPEYYHNNESACIAPSPYCSGGGHTDQSSCVNASYCTDGQWTNQTACQNEGQCWVHICWGGFGCFDFILSQYANNPSGCNAQPNASFSYAGNSWLNHNYTWYPPNVFTSHNYTWDSIVPDIDVEIPIAPDYLWKCMFPPHTFVNTTDSKPLDEEGYTTNYSGAYTHLRSQIRWKPPQRSSADYQRTYPRPTKFRIYRAPAYFQGYQLNTDHTEEMWKLAGEVTCRNDSGYHYFYDTREDMFNEGLREFEHAYYNITAVWEDWNWKLGYTINLYDTMSGPGNGASDSKWDIHHGQTWSAVVGNVMYSGICSNTNYVTQETCTGAGTCQWNSNYNNNVTLCLSFGTCTDPAYNNDEVGCIGAVGTWTPTYTWASANYTWTTGQWTGTANSSADLDNVENASPMGGYPQLMNAIRFTSLSNYRTYRASGYFRAPVTGTYYFQLRADDPAYLWLGNYGDSIAFLETTRTWYNATAEVAGNHPPQYNHWPDSATSLTAGEWYPLLAYGGQHQGGFAFDIRILYPSGDWNNNTGSEWKYVPFDMMPEDMDPGTDQEGQTVEGNWASQSVPAWYTGFP